MSPDAEANATKGLPENARRRLEPGEVYVPVASAETGVPEITGRSLALGFLFCALFSMAAAYLALVVGQAIEAAIPIAIVAVGLARFFPRRSSLIENVIITSIGANSGCVVAGSVFTIPALYMLAADPAMGVPLPNVLQVVLVSFLGGCIGILFLVPLRYSFMVENHGVFPWPEATATTEVLMTGESAGDSAKVLGLSAALGAAYDGVVTTFHGMASTINCQVGTAGVVLRKYFLTLRFSNFAALLGIGYIIGLKYDAILCAGSLLSFWVLVPIVKAVGSFAPAIVAPGTKLISAMTPDEVFRSYVRIIGVGGIAGAGIMGVVSSMPSMVRSIAANLRSLGHQDTREARAVPRVDRTLSTTFVAVGLVISAVLCLLFFSYGLGLGTSFGVAVVATVVVMAIAFLFAPVAARAVAIVGTNPISGMTMVTLILTGMVLLRLGLSGGRGMFLTMMVGGVVCTALSVSGGFATDLKVGHWLGATPARQIGLKFFGTFVAAIGCGVAMYVLARQPGGFGSAAIPAPQASAMKTILTGIFGAGSSGLQWYLFGLGVLLSLLLRMCAIPALPFSLGMYLPIDLNTTLLLGGLVGHFVNHKRAADSEASVKARENRGIIVASGLMAGGALMGMGDAVLKMCVGEAGQSRLHLLGDAAFGSLSGQWLAMGGMLLLALWTLLYSRRAKVPAG
jgi:putative OPT family oligopeptide transporter